MSESVQIVNHPTNPHRFRVRCGRQFVNVDLTPEDLDDNSLRALSALDSMIDQYEREGRDLELAHVRTLRECVAEIIRGAQDRESRDEAL